MTDVARPDGPGASDLLMGRYRLEERLGFGGSAEVWRGVDERLGRPVAVKLLHPHLLPDDAARARFEREARAAAALSHPGIVAVFDAQASASGAAIIFELVDGEPLSDRLEREGSLSVAEAARIGAEVAEALQHAHERGVVHRDVKPGNILLDGEGRARLVDFGIARLLEASSAHLTTAGTITGTLRYLAPEQLAGEEATAAADLYALGLVLYEMLAGRPAFDPPTPVALVDEQRHPPTDIPRVPAGLAAVTLAAMEPDPTKRPEGAGAMATELREWAAVSTRHATTIGAMPPDETAVGEGTKAMAPGGGDAPGGGEAPTVVVPAPRLAPTPDESLPESAWPLLPALVVARWNRTPWLAPVLSVAALALAFILFAGVAGPAIIGPDATASPEASLVTPSPTSKPTATASPEPRGEERGDDNKGKGRGRGNNDD